MVMKPMVLGEAPSMGKWHCSQKHPKASVYFIKKTREQNKNKLLLFIFLGRVSGLWHENIKLYIRGPSRRNTMYLKGKFLNVP